MNRAVGSAGSTTETALPPAEAGAADDTPELDLDRLVWDPEYREAMRPLLQHAG